MTLLLPNLAAEGFLRDSGAGSAPLCTQPAFLLGGSLAEPVFLVPSLASTTETGGCVVPLRRGTTRKAFGEPIANATGEQCMIHYVR